MVIMDDEIYCVENFEEKVQNMEAYFNTIGDRYFLEALHHFKLVKGFGIGFTSCYFATECQPHDEEYFGDTGVNFTTIPPVTSVEVYAIVDYETFYNYLKEVSENYVSRNPHNAEEVKACLKEIRHKFNIR